MKKIIFALCIAVLISVMSFSVFAEGDYYRLQDIAEPALLTESEYEDVLAKLDEVSQ